MILTVEYAESIKKRRLNRGWSRKELSEKTGVPETSIRRYEHAVTQTIPEDVYAKIENALPQKFEIDKESYVNVFGPISPDSSLSTWLSRITQADRAGSNHDSVFKKMPRDDVDKEYEILSHLLTNNQKRKMLSLAYALFRGDFD